jgi:hypothetical protein
MRPLYYAQNHSFECTCCSFNFHCVDLESKDLALFAQINQIDF